MLEEANEQLELEQMMAIIEGSIRNKIPFTQSKKYSMGVKAIFRGETPVELTDSDIKGKELEYRLYSNNVSSADYSRIRGNAREIQGAEFLMKAEKLGNLLEEKRETL